MSINPVYVIIHNPRSKRDLSLSTAFCFPCLWLGTVTQCAWAVLQSCCLWPSAISKGYSWLGILKISISLYRIRAWSIQTWSVLQGSVLLCSTNAIFVGELECCGAKKTSDSLNCLHLGEDYCRIHRGKISKSNSLLLIWWLLVNLSNCALELYILQGPARWYSSCC